MAVKRGEVMIATSSAAGKRSCVDIEHVWLVCLPSLDAQHVTPAYWMRVFGAAGETTPLRVAAAGREYDELVRVNGRWLIKVRDVAPKEER
jgi:hypothetical protein